MLRVSLLSLICRRTSADRLSTTRLYKDILGADEVVAWNSVIRANNDAAIPDISENRQKAVQKNAPPADLVKAISSSAHVDQDEVCNRLSCACFIR